MLVNILVELKERDNVQISDAALSRYAEAHMCLIADGCAGHGQRCRAAVEPLADALPQVSHRI